MEEAEYEVKAKVLKGITRLGIQPQNTEYLSFTRKLSDIIDKTGW
jgi:hypothetical protein